MLFANKCKCNENSKTLWLPIDDQQIHVVDHVKNLLTKINLHPETETFLNLESPAIVTCPSNISNYYFLFVNVCYY